MPDIHQPGPSDRAQAEQELRRQLSEQDLADLRRQARAQGIADADSLDEDDLIRTLRASAPSSQHDPNWPDAPKT